MERLHAEVREGGSKARIEMSSHAGERRSLRLVMKCGPEKGSKAERPQQLAIAAAKDFAM